MSENKKIKFRLNLFDIIIIVLVIAVAAAVVITKTGIFKKDVSTSPSSSSSNELVYSAEIYDLPESTASQIKVGDKMTDKIKKVEMGEIIDVQFEPYRKLTNDFVNGNVLQTEVPNRKKAIIKIKATATETDTEILVGNSYEVKVGKQVSVIGPGYAGTGYITEIERGNAQ